ncbi:MAG: acyltransferase [Proteobacteria bacterium]|nr:acyltransferase [Pseudomonadota bacterium]
MRGYAAIAVVFYHAIIGPDATQITRILIPNIKHITGVYNQYSKIVLAILNGDTAVVIFFVLSGTVLFDSLRHQSDRPLATSAKFVIRRVLRIYPPMIVGIFACVLAFGSFGRYFSPGEILGNIVLANYAVLGVAWTLQVEMLAVPFILLSFWAYRKYGAFGIVMIFVATIVAAKLASMFSMGGLVTFYARIFALCFTLGFLIPTPVGHWVAHKTPTAAWPFLLILMLAARHLIPPTRWTPEIQQVCAALIVALIYYRRAGALGRFLERPLSRYLGRISYSFYIFNVPILEIIAAIAARNVVLNGYFVEAGILAGIVIVLLTIPVAHLSERHIERPSIRWGHRFAARIAPRPAAAEPAPAPDVGPAIVGPIDERAARAQNASP